MAQEKEPFISSEERPPVSLHPDTPISELRVRDLQTLLQGAVHYKSPYIDVKWPEYKDNRGKPEKSETKDELKERKDEKYEYETRVSPPKNNKESETSSLGGRETVSSTAIDQLVQTISGLSQQVTNLTQEVEKLKQRSNEGQGT